MDLRACALLVALVAHCICMAFVSAAPQDSSDLSMRGNMVDDRMTAHSLAHIEGKLREDIDRELVDLMELTHTLKTSLDKAQMKKRQLEIKKRTPVQCLVNIVSCWRRK